MAAESYEEQRIPEQDVLRMRRLIQSSGRRSVIVGWASHLDSRLGSGMESAVGLWADPASMAASSVTFALAKDADPATWDALAAALGDKKYATRAAASTRRDAQRSSTKRQGAATHQPQERSSALPGRCGIPAADDRRSEAPITALGLGLCHGHHINIACLL
jgi:hypothetical protein